MLKIFNTLNNVIQTFHSFKNKVVNLYVCGITPYDFCHIGHARVFIFFDIVIRYFRFLGYKVIYIRNITDIDDKIIQKSIQKNTTCQDITNSIIYQTLCDFNNLNIIPPNKEPKVTDNIENIIKMIKTLLYRNNAYVSDNGDVCFSVDSFNKYGKLSNQKINNLKSTINNNKKLDFVLWKKVSNKNYPYWESPWGIGRPGWHIECSAINCFYFKENCDIHGGGIDLLFPHHENEKSQSDSYLKKVHVNYWMHVGMVLIKNQKMSKSLNNTKKLHDLLLKYDSEVIRYYILSRHYRKPLYYHESDLIKSKKSLIRLYNSLQGFNLSFSKKYILKKNFSSLSFEKYMNLDFNTPHVFLILFKISKKINILKNINIKKAKKLAYKLKFLGNILGLLFYHPEDFLKKELNKNVLSFKKINLLIYYRNIYRNLKNWSKSDTIRKKLLDLNIKLKDSKYTTNWYYTD
ncbi:cysteine--tRNA ligase [Buchnera aphidicola (Kurisakia onigurumii)]|uniref:cysteine--tRNA ligase n=1 Tax=Buchnera aphidicola TaxID=9 RepID=UPI0031B6E744